MGMQEFAWRHFHFSKEYAKRMAGMGHEVTLYVLQKGPSEPTTFRLDGYDLTALGTTIRLPPFMKFGNNHSSQIFAELRRFSPDLVHVHNYYLWNFPYTAPWAKAHGARVVAQYHGTDPIRTIKGAAYLPSLRICDGLLVPTEKEEQFLTRVLHLPSPRVARFPSTGVDGTAFRKTVPRDSSVALLYVGRIPVPTSYKWEKAPHYLVPIVSALKRRGVHVTLSVAGDGPGLESMRAFAERAGVSEEITFLGPLSQGMLPDIYSRSWITFVPLWMDEIEPFWGGTVQESLACGTPVVAFNDRNPGPRRFGLLVPSDPELAADYILPLLKEQQTIEQMGKEGATFTSKNCSWDNLISGLDRIYQRVSK